MLKDIEFKKPHFRTKDDDNVLNLTNNCIILCPDLKHMDSLAEEIVNTVNGNAEYNDYWCEDEDVGKAKYILNFGLQKVIDVNGQKITLALEPSIIYKAKNIEDIWFFDWLGSDEFGTHPYEEFIYPMTIFKGSHYVMEIVYEIEVPDCNEESERICSIDLGTENLVTMVNNIGEQPIVIKGGAIKSTNQFYNKKKSELQSKTKKENKAGWSNRLQRLTDKRYEKIKYLMHCASKKVIDYCVLYGIDTLIVGLNKKWKQENQQMQNFTYIPYDMFINQLESKCNENGIKFITTEEGYTSGTSFLDNEMPVKENYRKERRVYRGLFISDKGIKINADVNGAYQIMKKVFPNILNKGIEGAGLHPVRMKIA